MEKYSVYEFISEMLKEMQLCEFEGITIDYFGTDLIVESKYRKDYQIIKTAGKDNLEILHDISVVINKYLQ